MYLENLRPNDFHPAKLQVPRDGNPSIAAMLETDKPTGPCVRLRPAYVLRSVNGLTPMWC